MSEKAIIIMKLVTLSANRIWKHQLFLAYGTTTGVEAREFGENKETISFPPKLSYNIPPSKDGLKYFV